MAAITAAVAGVAVAGASVYSAAKGGKSTAQQQTTSQDGTSQAYFDTKSDAQTGLEQNSLDQYQKQLALINQQEQQLSQYDPLTQGALKGTQDVLSGQAFNLTPQEQQQIQNLRQALIDQGQFDLNYQTDQGVAKATSGAAGRGLRGQALGQVRGQVVNEGQRLGAGIINNANTIAAQQAISTPLSRIQAQSPFLQQGLTLQQQLQQQAIQNRSQAQNPYLLQMMQQERLAHGRTVTTGNGAQQLQIPGMNAGQQVLGAVGGVAGGIQAGTNLYNSLNNLSGSNSTNYNMSQPSTGSFAVDPSLRNFTY